MKLLELMTQEQNTARQKEHDAQIRGNKGKNFGGFNKPETDKGKEHNAQIKMNKNDSWGGFK